MIGAWIVALLKLGSRGADVAALQQGLKTKGYAIADPDGVFGASTDAAVRSFQGSVGLNPDGWAGEMTQEALFPTPWPERPGELARFTPFLVGRMFPGTRLFNIAANLPHILDGLEAAQLTDRSMGLMALATLRAESASFGPIDEGVSRFNTDTNAAPFNRYDAGTPIGARLGNTGAGDGAKFKGRGFVQLTGRDNYARIGAEIGRDLVARPEDANEPATAGLILGRFLKNSERRIRRALASRDFVAALKAVNGGRHGLAEFEACYLAGERLLA